MKIFALNLCLQFEVKDTGKNYEYPPISFEELMGELFKGSDLEGRKFYVLEEDMEKLSAYVFDLQANDVFRDIEITVSFLFRSEQQLEDFLDGLRDKYKQTDAAGGLVENEKGEYLCIFTRQKWTLPKGGVEWREPVEDAAVREVKEETGLNEVEIVAPFIKTYHTFRRSKRWVFKTTHWYKMRASSTEELSPQEEEEIEDVAWMSKEQWLEVAPESYPLIKDLFQEAFAESLTS